MPWGNTGWHRDSPAFPVPSLEGGWFWHSLAPARAQGAGFSCWRLQAASPPRDSPDLSIPPSISTYSCTDPPCPVPSPHPKGLPLSEGTASPQKKGLPCSRGAQQTFAADFFMIAMGLRVCIRGGERRENLHMAAAWWAGELPRRLRTAFIPLLGGFLGARGCRHRSPSPALFAAGSPRAELCPGSEPGALLGLPLPAGRLPSEGRASDPVGHGHLQRPGRRRVPGDHGRPQPDAPLPLPHAAQNPEGKGRGGRKSPSSSSRSTLLLQHTNLSGFEPCTPSQRGREPKT